QALMSEVNVILVELYAPPVASKKSQVLQIRVIRLGLDAVLPPARRQRPTGPGELSLNLRLCELAGGLHVNDTKPAIVVPEEVVRDVVQPPRARALGQLEGLRELKADVRIEVSAEGRPELKTRFVSN